MSNHIDFYFDIISPYAYIAYKKILKINNVDFKLKPILLGGLHNLAGITAPAFNKYKMKNMQNDCELVSKKNNISFKWNSKFPINSLLKFSCSLIWISSDFLWLSNFFISSNISSMFVVTVLEILESLEKIWSDISWTLLYKKKFVKKINDEKVTTKKMMNMKRNDFSKMLKLPVPLLKISVV